MTSQETNRVSEITRHDLGTSRYYVFDMNCSPDQNSKRGTPEAGFEPASRP
jgi:hypothetical protein